MQITALADDAEHRYWDHETGSPTVMHFANAVQVWAMAQDGSVDVEDAARVFNVAVQFVHQAIEAHPWMLLGRNGEIEHEGE